MSTLRILIADDHPVSRSGLEFLLASDDAVEVIGMAASGEETLSRVAQLEPDLVILDLMLPHTSGLVALEQLTHQPRRPRVVVLSGQASAVMFKAAFDLGAEGLVSKEEESAALLDAIRKVGDGGRYLSPVVAGLIGTVGGEAGAQTLTAREREVLALVGDGESNLAIAKRLGISAGTVKKHRENIRAKLGISSTVDAARAAARLGLSSNA